MPSNYTAFDVKFDNYDGQPVPVANAVVKVRDVQDANPTTGVGAIALPDIAADANGHVAAGVLAIAAGRKVRFFWVRDADGRCGSAIMTTT